MCDALCADGPRPARAILRAVLAALAFLAPTPKKLAAVTTAFVLDFLPGDSQDDDDDDSAALVGDSLRLPFNELGATKVMERLGAGDLDGGMLLLGLLSSLSAICCRARVLAAWANNSLSCRIQRKLIS